MPPLKRFRPIASAPGPITSSSNSSLIPPSLTADWSSASTAEETDVDSHVNAPIKCFFCRFEAYDRMEFFQHMRHEHLGNPVVKCNLCLMEYGEDEALLKHYLDDHFTCKLCGYVEMAYEHGVETHMKFHHSDEDRRHGCGGLLEPVDLPIP